MTELKDTETALVYNPEANDFSLVIPENDVDVGDGAVFLAAIMIRAQSEPEWFEQIVAEFKAATNEAISGA